MKQNYSQFEYKARYFQLGDMSKKTENLIFVIHGYGQQAKYFIQKFKSLDTGANCIVAPEGLSRFYLEGFSGRVGATWMTKEDRLTDIENYTNYLNAVYHDVTNGLSTLPNISVIGFSQGSATVSRWLTTIPAKVDRLILWAGIFPPDLNYKIAIDKYKSIDITYVYGLQDPFLTKERLAEMRQISKELKVKPKIVTFEGEHVIDTSTLQKLFSV